MPVIVQFRRKNTEAEFGTAYLELDKEICSQILQLEPDVEKWGGGACDWYNGIIFAFALGHTFESLRTIYGQDSVMLTVLNYLEQHFEWDCFRTFGKGS